MACLAYLDGTRPQVLQERPEELTEGIHELSLEEAVVVALLQERLQSAAAPVRKSRKLAVSASQALRA